MKRQLPLVIAICVGFSSASNVFAGVLPKDILSIKESFDKVGATSCSQALAETLHFLAKGRSISNNKQWSTSDTNKKPISIDFLISGTKSDYSTSGAIVLTPTGNKCVGTYVYSLVAPSENCKTYMQKAGFDGPDWSQDMTYPNGDGGTAYFLSVKKNSGLNFIFNDVAGGCSLTKRETLMLDAGK
jgi:hypothetical protein